MSTPTRQLTAPAAVVDAAIDADLAIANAVAILQGSIDHHHQHAGRWLARAMTNLDLQASLSDAERKPESPLLTAPELRGLGNPLQDRPPIRSWTSDEDHAWLQKHMRGRCVEVGSAAGASAAAMIHIAELTCIDVWSDAGDTTIPDLPSRMDEFLSNLDRFPHRSRVKVLRLPSPAAARSFEVESLDCVFLDGDHREPAVLADIDAWWPKLKPGGMLCGHDYGHPDFPGVAAAVRARFPDAHATKGTIWHAFKPSLFPPSPEHPDHAGPSGNGVDVPSDPQREPAAAG